MKTFKGKVLFIIALFLFVNKSFPLSTIYFFETPNLVEIINSNNEELEEIKALLKKKKNKEALEKLYKYISEVENNKNKTMYIESTIVLADIFRDNGDYLKSNKIFNKTLKINSLDVKSRTYIYFKIGGNFQLDNKVDSAKVYYEKALILSNKLDKSEDLKAKIHGNLSGIYYLLEKYDVAIEHSKKAANYQKIIGNKEVEAGILNNLGSIYYMQGNYKDALKTFENALSLVGFGQSELQKQGRRSSYINIAYAHSSLNNFEKAFEFQDKYFSLSDSMNQELKYKEISEIQSKFEVEKKEKEAEIEKVKRVKVEYFAIILGIVLLILLTGLFVIYKWYKLSKRAYQLQLDQEQLKNQNKLDKIKSDSQEKLLVATLDGRLEERKKIAEVLHDNVSAMLSAASLHLFATTKKLHGEIPVEIKKSQQIINEASDKIRDLSHILMPTVLLKFGVGVAVQDICEKSSNSELRLSFKENILSRYQQNFEINMFNICAELINNMLKHSNASKGLVELKEENGNLMIFVTDNGKGFVMDEIQSKNGIGLSHINTRIRNFGGDFAIDSSAKGTNITVKVPIQH